MVFFHHSKKLEVLQRPLLGTVVELAPAGKAPLVFHADTTSPVFEQAESIFLIFECPGLLVLK